MKVLIIEDEKSSADKLSGYLHSIDPEIDILGSCSSVKESVEFLTNSKSLKPDLIYLDVSLSDGSSFRIFEEVSVDSFIVFLTAYDEFALDAFKLKSIDYVLKPFSQKDIQGSLDKFKALRPQPSALATDQVKTRFLAKKGQQLVSIHESDIAYFYIDKLVMLKKTDGEVYIYDQPLDVLETQLDSSHFFRVNRQFIVNYSSIESLSPSSSNRFKVQVKPTPPFEIMVSQNKVTHLRQWLTS